MDKKGQFLTLVFTVLSIIIIIGALTLEYSSISSNQSLNAIMSSYSASKAITYNLLHAYSTLNSASPSQSAYSLYMGFLSYVQNNYMPQYSLNGSSGSVSNSYSSGSFSHSVNILISTHGEPAITTQYQQSIVVNSSLYTTYESPSLNNVLFSYQNGSIIPSWLESGNLPNFNGNNSYINTSYIQTNTAFSFSIWFYPTRVGNGGSKSTGYSEDILSSSGCATNTFWIEYRNDGSFELGTYNGTGASSNLKLGNLTADYQWYNVVVVYNPANGQVTSYLDGAKWGGGTAKTWNANDPCRLQIGGGSTASDNPVGYNNNFDGYMANVQFYNSQLTAIQAAGLYNSGPAGTGISTKSGYWRLAGNSYDYSGNNNNGLLKNIVFDAPGSASTYSSYYLKLDPLAANSTKMIYLDIYQYGTTFNAINTGEAPQFSPIHGEYDDGSKVFIDYYSGSTSAGWSISGSAGVTTSASPGSPFGADALYANSSRGDYIYTNANYSSNQNIIIQYFTYTTDLGNLFFSANSGGAGTMSRLDSRGGGNYIGFAKTANWDSWFCPESGKTASVNTWYTWTNIIAGSSSSIADYFTPTSNQNMYPVTNYGTQINSMGTGYSDGCGGGSEIYSYKGGYVGLMGDALGSSHITYWNGIIVRAFPPNGVMPNVSFGSLN